MGKNKKKRAIERAQGYADRLEQRLLIRELGRERFEQELLKGHIFGAEWKRDQLQEYFQARLWSSSTREFVEELIARSVSLQRAKREIDKYIEDFCKSRAKQSRVRPKAPKWLKLLELQLDKIPEDLAKLYQRASIKDDSYRISGIGLALAVEGVDGPYDDVFPGGAVFWRGDTRPPSEVRKTGFTPKVERDFGPAGREGGGNTIIYRTGDDDIVPASGVCIAKDIRGGAFFPFSRGPAYLYAIVVKEAVNTYRAQRRADHVESGRLDWRDPSRFQYDPTEAHSDEASTVWQYREYVVHRIAPEQIVGAWSLKREFLVDSTVGDDSKVGIRFKLSGPNLWHRTWSAPSVLAHRSRAEAMAAACSEFYPRHPDHYLSYQGIVRKVRSGRPTSTTQAENWASQVNPLPPLPPPLKQQSLDRLERQEANRRRHAEHRRNKRSERQLR